MSIPAAIELGPLRQALEEDVPGLCDTPTATASLHEGPIELRSLVVPLLNVHQCEYLMHNSDIRFMFDFGVRYYFSRNQFGGKWKKFHSKEELIELQNEFSDKLNSYPKEAPLFLLVSHFHEDHIGYLREAVVQCFFPLYQDLLFIVEEAERSCLSEESGLEDISAIDPQSFLMDCFRDAECIEQLKNILLKNLKFEISIHASNQYPPSFVLSLLKEMMRKNIRRSTRERFEKCVQLIRSHPHRMYMRCMSQPHVDWKNFFSEEEGYVFCTTNTASSDSVRVIIPSSPILPYDISLFLPPYVKPRSRDINDNSLMADIVSSQASVLLTFDATPKVFKPFIPKSNESYVQKERNCLRSHYDLIFWPHHGSDRTDFSVVLKVVECYNFIVRSGFHANLRSPQKHFIDRKKVVLTQIKDGITERLNLTPNSIPVRANIVFLNCPDDHKYVETFDDSSVFIEVHEVKNAQEFHHFNYTVTHNKVVLTHGDEEIIMSDDVDIDSCQCCSMCNLL
ncbi:hypothetical protein PCE1_001334 [Barthelona sp. PCE]